MNDLNAMKQDEEITPQDKILNAHQFLKDFLDKFESAQRGGIHDFIEIALFNIVNSSVKNIDIYLSTGHKSVNPKEIMSIFADSCQKVLDKIKINLEQMDKVNFK